MTPEQQRALDEYLAGLNEYGKFNAAQYNPEILTQTGLENLQFDPAMREYELQALRALEQQGREGFTAQDRAAMARTEQEVSRMNRGEQGALKAEMQRRGVAGSGMELAARQMAAQNANEIAAMRALEQEAAGQQRRQQGVVGAAQLAGNIGNRDYQNAAQKASAQAEINRFNAENRMAGQRFNIGQQDARARRQMEARTGAGQMRYNAATEAERQRLMREEEDRRRKGGIAKAVLGGLGAAGGYYYGKSPQAASAGYEIGSGIGEVFGFADGGQVEPWNLNLKRSQNYNLDLPKFSNVVNPDPEDVVNAKLSFGETVLPPEVAKDPAAAAQFVADQNKIEQAYNKARDMQDAFSYADLAAKGISDFAQSQKRNVYLPSSFQDLGKGPDVYRSKMPEFQPGSIAKLGEQGFSEVEQQDKRARQKFADANTLEAMSPDSNKAKAAQTLLRATVANKIREAKRFKDEKTANELKKYLDAETLNLSAPDAVEIQKMIKDIDYSRAYDLLEKQLKENLAQSSSGTKSPEGKPVSGEQAAKLAGYDAAKQLVMRMSKDWEEKASQSGSGLKSWVPFISTDPKKYQEGIKPFVQQIGGFLEGGKLTDDDYDRYQNMMPTPWDTAEQKQNKIIKLMQAIEAKQQAEFSALENVGYRVPAFNKGVTLDNDGLSDGRNLP